MDFRNRPVAHRRNHLRIVGAALAALALGHGPAAWAQTKQVISFAGVTFSEAGRGDRLRAWVDKFNKSQNTVEVQTIAMPFATLAKTVFTQMGGGAGPDLVRFDLMDYYAAVAADRVLPLDDIIKTSDYKFAATDKYMSVGGKRYGIAFETSNYVLLYNPALLPGGKPPANFDEFLAAGKTVTANGVYGYAYRATMAEGPGYWQDLCNFVYGFGGRWSDDKGNLTLNSPKVIEGVAAYKKVYDAGMIPKGTDAATYRRMFWERKLAMEVDNGGVAGIFNQQAPDLPFNAAPSPFPTRAQGLVYAPLTINANTKNKAAAATFVKWVMQPENQSELQALLGASSVATIVPRSADDLAKKPWLKVYDDQTQYSVPQLVYGQEVKTPEIQQIVLESVLKVLQGGVDPKKAMDDAQQQAVSRVLRKKPRTGEQAMSTQADPAPAAAPPLQRIDWVPYLFVAPLVVYLLLFQGYPLLQELYLSFTSTSLLSPGKHKFVGLENYTDLLAMADFRHVLWVTAVYTASCVLLSIGLGLGAALLLDAPFRGRAIARSLVTIPWAAPPVAVSLIFIWIYNGQYGIANHGLKLFSAAWGSESWLDSPELALPAVLATTVWQIFPFASVVLLAALQGVSSELREAAVIDGADRLSVFRAVVWPTIQPTVALLSLFVTIWSLRRFDLIWLMTQGGPIGSTNTLVIELYRRAFTYRELGAAAAVGMVGLAIALLVTVVYFRYSTRAARAAESR